MTTPEPTQVCGRCRGTFPREASTAPRSLPEWWACPACRAVLFGEGR